MDASRDHESDLIGPSGAELQIRESSAGNARAGIALALGGGFSRGFAHLGVLEVLEQEQIPISCIVGTSIGGLLGAAYADGIPIHQLCELGRQVRVRDFIRFHRSAEAPQNSGGPQREPAPCDRIGQFVRVWLRANRVEELPIRTAIVTTDLETGAPYVFTRGPLDVAIRAGCAFPGLFQPVEYDGRRLADGCIVAPVPTAVAARMNCACVVAVAVSSNHKKSSSSDNVLQVRDPDWSGALGSAMTPSWITQADILLEPEVNQIEWIDFSRVHEAYDAGVDAMRRAVPRLRQLLALRCQMRFRQETSGQRQGEAQAGPTL